MSQDAMRRAAITLSCLCLLSCGGAPSERSNDPSPTAAPDGFFFPEDDLASDLAYSGPPDACGDSPPGPLCYRRDFGPPSSPFGLQRDPMKDPMQGDSGVTRDPDGLLVLQGGIDGTYHVVTHGCGYDGSGEPTLWYRVHWDGETPPGTSIRVRARSGQLPDPTDWGANPWTPDTTRSPIDLQATLTPNATWQNLWGAQDDYLLVELRLHSDVPGRSPRLRSFTVGYQCRCVCS